MGGAIEAIMIMLMQGEALALGGAQPLAYLLAEAVLFFRGAAAVQTVATGKNLPRAATSGNRLNAVEQIFMVWLQPGGNYAPLSFTERQREPRTECRQRIFRWNPLHAGPASTSLPRRQYVRAARPVYGSCARGSRRPIDGPFLAALDPNTPSSADRGTPAHGHRCDYRLQCREPQRHPLRRRLRRVRPWGQNQFGRRRPGYRPRRNLGDWAGDDFDPRDVDRGT